jgi:hypothetical protein
MVQVGVHAGKGRMHRKPGDLAIEPCLSDILGILAQATSLRQSVYFGAKYVILSEYVCCFKAHHGRIIKIDDFGLFGRQTCAGQTFLKWFLTAYELST